MPLRFGCSALKGFTLARQVLFKSNETRFFICLILLSAEKKESSSLEKFYRVFAAFELSCQRSS
jgi:hypothetical protein